MSNNYVVYVHINKTNGKRYYGITGMKPEYRWNHGKGYVNNKYFSRAINKYGWDGFEHIIVARNLSKDEATWLEIELIAAYDTTNIDNGYNISSGGDCSAIGFHHTEEAKKKMSETRKGENNGMYGRTHTEEVKRKLSESRKGKNNPMYGRTPSKEIIDNLIKCRARQVVCVTTGEIFYTIADASRKYKMKDSSYISACCRGRQKSAGKLPDGTKLVWRYVNYKHNKTYRVA